MCTVTFIARRNGYALGMNRDEKWSRIQARPPARQEVGGHTALFPSEPGGGTWIGVNDAGVTLALLNWYAVCARVPAHPVSRGELVRSALASTRADSLAQFLAAHPLERTNPFRLVAIFPGPRQVIEWRWNLTGLDRMAHPWETNVWISSGFDEAAAQESRRRVFEQMRRKHREQDARWLRAFHGSHRPARGPCSVCVHRHDAGTVSYTEIAVRPSAIRMAYSPRALCAGAAASTHILRLLAQ